MNSLPTQLHPVRLAGERQVSLGASHGYRLDGDTVHLHAMFNVHNEAAHDRAWTLQLWACPSAPSIAAELNGHLVAQSALPPIGEIADDTHAFDVSTFAEPPAGQSDHVMVLALVGDGEVHDFWAYPCRESFPAPSLHGAASYFIDGERVRLAVEAIKSPRSADNLSGTLALELWALTGRYDGGDFRGVPLSGVAFDPLFGQCEYRWREFDLPFTAPPAGDWQLVLMLREWTAAGFVTRDYVNFDLPYIQPAPVEAIVSKPVEALPVVPTAPPATEKKVAVAASKVAPSVSEPNLAEALQAAGVSVNRASVEEIAKVKGMTRKLADAIVKKRPFRSLDELLHVKGMGAKLFTKLRSGLKL